MIEYVIGLVAVVLIITLIIIFVSLYKKYTKMIVQNSKRLKKLFDLNDNTKFNYINQRQYYFHQTCNSKRQLDKLNLNEYFVGMIEGDFDYFKNIYEPIIQNNEIYQDYINKCASIKSEATDELCKELKTKLKKFLKREDSLFKKNQLLPVLDITIELKATYTSPAGRNSYWKKSTYDYDEFKSIFEYATLLILNKQTRQYQIKLERAKLNDSLRYDVLRRDNFRCKICGASANDGVKLHVDHIIPVSKGGKTTMDNLRTLCDRCNMGKSDKLE